MSFLATISTSIHAVYSSDSYNRPSPSKTCGRCSLTHNSSGHCPTSNTQCCKCGCSITSSLCATTAHHLYLPPEEETTNQLSDADQVPAIKEAEIRTKKGRKIHINIIIIKIIHNNSRKTHTTIIQPSIPQAKIQMKELFKGLGKYTGKIYL